jgi:hypothetical protein
MESHSKVSLEVNKTQALMKLSTKREVSERVTSKLKDILGKGLSCSTSKKICIYDHNFFGVDNGE